MTTATISSPASSGANSSSTSPAAARRTTFNSLYRDTVTGILGYCTIRELASNSAVSKIFKDSLRPASQLKYSSLSYADFPSFKAIRGALKITKLGGAKIKTLTLQDLFFKTVTDPELIEIFSRYRFQTINFDKCWSCTDEQRGIILSLQEDVEIPSETEFFLTFKLSDEAKKSLEKFPFAEQEEIAHEVKRWNSKEPLGRDGGPLDNNTRVRRMCRIKTEKAERDRVEAEKLEMARLKDL